MSQFSDPPGPVGAVWKPLSSNPVGAVRNADRIWVSTPQNRTLCVNLRKELVCSRAIHAPLIFKEKRRVNCATTNADILVLCVI